MIPVLYEDPSLLVCIKPAGMLSQPSEAERESLLELLGAQQHCTLYPVHRLDRGVGGVMVCAKTSRAAGGLSTAVQRRALEKEYLCITRGCPNPEEGVWRDLLLHDRSRNKSFVVQRMRGGAKEASLAYQVVAGGRNRHWYVSSCTRDAPTRFGSSLPAVASPCWGTANTAAAQGTSPCGVSVWPSPTRTAESTCPFAGCRRGPPGPGLSGRTARGSTPRFKRSSFSFGKTVCAAFPAV